MSDMRIHIMNSHLLLHYNYKRYLINSIFGFITTISTPFLGNNLAPLEQITNVQVYYQQSHTKQGS